jgi:hypothetical protein
VKVADQARYSREVSIINNARVDDAARDERQDLAGLLVDPEGSRGAAKSHLLKVSKQLMHSRRPGPSRASDRLADTAHFAGHVAGHSGIRPLHG